jgi:transposase
MTRTLRTWLSGDREVARDVQIPSVEQEDAKRIERERKYLVEERISIVGRIKGLLAPARDLAQRKARRKRPAGTFRHNEDR